ncbi:hypothetical protein [Gymnodinialimonas sp.]
MTDVTDATDPSDPTDPTDLPDPVDPAQRLSLTSQHLPSVLAGNYVLHVDHAVGVPDAITHTTETATYTADHAFTVSGDRFRVPPQHIRNVFPPPGSLGDHANALPHIMFNRTTLPWERLPNADQPEPEPQRRDRMPWLALLLFDEDDPQPVPSTTTIGALRAQLSTPDPAAPRFTMGHFTPEFGKTDDTEVRVIDVSADLLRRICPTWVPGAAAPWHALYYTAHVRQMKDAAEVVTSELSCITGTRLARPGKSATVHLVSIEARFDAEGMIDLKAAGAAQVRFISLHSWRYSCKSRSESFKGLLEKIDITPARLHLLPNAMTGPSAALQDAAAEGYVPLEYRMRDGSATAALYRGPLVPHVVGGTTGIPHVATADALLRRHDSGLLDISLAAAWELGRGLTLKRRIVARALFHWKRQHLRAIRNARWHLDHLPFRPLDGAPDLPPEVASWFDDLARLRHVPMAYLFAQDALLPVESLRLLAVDPQWVAALQAGAFSVGRLSHADLAHEPTLPQPATPPAQVISGIVLRSDAVKGWPDLQVTAYAQPQGGQASDPGLPRFRHEPLSDHMLLALFHGQAEALRVAQKAEVLHFGFDRPDSARTDIASYTKPHRQSDGTVDLAQSVSLAGHADPATRVVDLAGLEAALRPAAPSEPPMSSGDFAFQMVVGVESVMFHTNEAAPEPGQD